VHKFSRPFMPIGNLVKNCSYYYGFTLLVAYPLAHPLYTPPGAAQVAGGAALWLASQAVNLAVHLQLAGMRSQEGDDSRRPPEGLLFSLVTSPNYTSEVLAWVGWSLVSNVAMGYLFTLAGFAQMAQWSLQKYAGYKADKDGAGREYAQKRKAILPFLL
jgi:very-long-chain enoyl-CoA reductase